MPIRDVFRESIANLTAEGWRLPVMVAVLAILAFVGSVLELDTTRQSIDLARTLEAAGNSVWVATSTENSSIDSKACQRLAEITAVERVGGMARGASAAIEIAPDTRFAVNRFVGDVAVILSNDTQNASVDAFTSQQLAAQLGLGGRIPTSLDDGRVLHNIEALDLSERVEDPGSEIWVRDATVEQLDSCYVEFHQRDAVQPDVLHAALDRAGDHFPIRPYISSDRFRADPLATFEGRPTRILWLLTGVASGLLLAVPQFFRRHWIALYRSVGVSRPSTILIAALPTIPLLAGSVLAGTSTALLWILSGTSLDAWDFVAVATRFGVLHLSISLLVVFGVVVSLAMGDTSQQLRRRT